MYSNFYYTIRLKLKTDLYLPVTQVEELRLQMAELNQQLARADERYNARPSRPEDLNKILQLENTIVEADERIKHLIVRIFVKFTSRFLLYCHVFVMSLQRDRNEKT